jgi:hypothetical protein
LNLQDGAERSEAHHLLCVASGFVPKSEQEAMCFAALSAILRPSVVENRCVTTAGGHENLSAGVVNPFLYRNKNVSELSYTNGHKE